MSIEVRNRISPPTPVQANPVSAEKVKEPTLAVDSNEQPKVDFGRLMTSSNTEVQRERESKVKGDFSGLSQSEFFDKLNKETSDEFKTPKNKLDKTDFLRLFVEQLKNQDPLNPDDGAELAAKLAQFNSVEQMMAMNKSLSTMAKEQSTDRSLQLTNFIGKDLQIKGGRLKIKGGDLSEGSFNLSKPTAQTSLQVRDETGRLVHEKKLGMVQKGAHKLSWDGKDHKGQPISDGTYTFQIVANDVNGANVPVDITSKVNVTGVDVTDKDGKFFTNFGPVKLKDITSIGLEGYLEDASSAAKTPSKELTVAAGIKAMASPTGALPKELAKVMKNINPAVKTDKSSAKPQTNGASEATAPKSGAISGSSATPSSPAVPNFRFSVPNPAPQFVDPSSF
jgi:flagellar hook assembly protein FlgD